MMHRLVGMYLLDSRSIPDAPEKPTESNNSEVFESVVSTRKTTRGIAAIDDAGISMSDTLHTDYETSAYHRTKQ